jgi:HPt (histidine-containing phosphotransfer) domain-containing protein
MTSSSSTKRTFFPAGIVHRVAARLPDRSGVRGAWGHEGDLTSVYYSRCHPAPQCPEHPLPRMSHLPDGPLERALCEKLLARTRDELASMRSALAERDFAALVQLAHRLGGAAGALGLAALADAAYALEKAGERGDLPGVTARFGLLERELERTAALIGH